jgi:hypothetical protein
MPNKKKTKRKAPARSRRAGVMDVFRLQVPITFEKASVQDVEQAIAEKLRTVETDLFRKTEKVIIECEQFDFKHHH